jgi:hypothetical protein
MTQPELILYRISADNPHGINDVPQRLRGFLDSCAECHDGALHSPTSLTAKPGRTVASYECESNHCWTRSYTT